MTAWLSPKLDINVKGDSNRLQWHVNCRIYHLLSKQIFQVLPIASSLAFLSRLCKKKFPVTRFRFCQQNFCSQQIFFLSADSISKFLSSADLFFVSKCLCGRHGNDAHAGIFSFAPACVLPEKFSPSAGPHFRFYHDSICFAGPSQDPWACAT